MLNLTPPSRRSGVRKTRRGFQPRCEQLEPRAMPAADLLQNMVAEIMEQAPEVVPTTPYYLGLMKPDGSFRDLNYSGTSDKSAGNLQQHGVRLEVLSLAYKWNDAGNTLYGDAALKAKIVKGWSYVAARGGYVNAPNWWWKEIGVPQGMSDGLVLMRSEIPASVRTQILNKYFRLAWNPTKHDGANLAYQAPNAMIDGLLRGDTGRIRSVVSSVSRELMAYTGEGIQYDLSFLQHRVGGKLNFHNGSYGLVVARDVSRVMRWAGGTAYAFGTAAVDQQVRFVLDGLAWQTRGDTFDIPSQGRSVTNPGSPTAAPYSLRNAMADLALLGRRSDELLAGVDRYHNGVSDTNFLSGSKVFWKGDALAHQRPTFMATLKMISSRTARPETAAGSNTRGFFEGDGFTTIVKDGDEFGARGAAGIMSVWDWQRLPGTTVEHNGVIPYYDMFKTATNSTGASTLVGAASDGQYAVAGMDYKRSGVSVTAKKAWFFFDNEFVALGADIDNTGGSAVFTSLNQVLLDGTVTVGDAAGRRTIELGDSAALSGPAWIEHDGVGYLSLDASNRINVQAKLQAGGGAALPVFSAWVDHGVRPQNASYAYVVIPQVTADDVSNYAESPPVVVVANTASVQAVRHVGLKQTQAAFYAAGSVDVGDGLVVSVDRAANVIVQQAGEALTITAADPRQSSVPLNITVNRRVTGAGAQVLADAQSTRIVFSLPAAPYNGASATRTFQLPASDTPEGEAALLVDMAMSSVISSRSAAPAGAGRFLASQPASGSALQPRRDLNEAPSLWRRTAKLGAGERLAAGHGGALDFTMHGTEAVDAALGIWNEADLPGQGR